MLTWAGVALCGALGALARFGVDAAVSARVPSSFPWGILVVNLTGSAGLGVLLGAAASSGVTFLFGTGFLGAYTTFSTWMVDSERLREDRRPGLLLTNLLGSWLAGLAFAASGWYAGGLLT